AFAGGTGAAPAPQAFNVAFVQGKNSLAVADGLGNAAVNFGDNSKTYAVGAGNFAANSGNFSDVRALGVFNRAFSVGNGNDVQAFNYPTGLTDIGNNTALNFGNDNLVRAGQVYSTDKKSNNFAAALGVNDRYTLATGAINRVVTPLNP